MRRSYAVRSCYSPACNADKIAQLESKNKALDQKLQELTTALAAKSGHAIMPDNEVYTLYRRVA